MRTWEEEMRLKHERRNQRLRGGEGPTVDESMRKAQIEAGWGGVAKGITETYLSPLALLLSAENFFISILTTLPNLVGSVVQLAAPRVLKWFGCRRRYLVALYLLQGVSLVALPFLRLLPTHAALGALLLLVITNASFSLLLTPVWTSYIGDLVPEQKRTKFFAFRQIIMGSAVFAMILIASGLLAIASDFIGFTILFLLAGIARFVGAYLYSQVKEIPHQEPKRDDFSFREFLRRSPRSDFGKFVTFTGLLRFVVYIASPFFVIYQLKVLQISYTKFTLLQLAMLIGAFLSLWFWSTYAEKRGTKNIFIWSTILISLVPLLYLTTKNYHWLFVFEFVSGFAWGGFNLALSNYPLEATSPESRVHVISYFNLITNFFIFLGGIVGALLLWGVKLFTTEEATPFLCIFLISGILRFAVWLFYRTTLRELRFVEINVGNAGILSLLPSKNYAPAFFAPTPADFSERVRTEQWEGKLILDLKHEQGDDLVDRMAPKEREVYAKKFVERIQKK